MKGKGNGDGALMRAQLDRVDRRRDELAKRWLSETIELSPLAEVEQLPTRWVARQLPDLISDILGAIPVEDGKGRPKVTTEGVTALLELRLEMGPARHAWDLSRLHALLIETLQDQLPSSEPDLFTQACKRLAEIFGVLNGAAVNAISARSEGERDPVTGLWRSDHLNHRLGQMVEGQKRYGHPFSLVLFDFEGPGTEGSAAHAGEPTAFTTVAGALRDSIRTVDEAYRLDQNEICVLAPNQLSPDAARMAGRLGNLLEDIERRGGLKVTASAGIVSCPEHGEEPDRLLRRADTAMWRARATGQPLAVGGLQDS